uniref:Uncharacterized protein n=1 Tax=Mycoplasma suis TaxID=57372 RepID=Q8KM77_9MOLU|nr:hypothetical protein [Mycoplasma suis]
MKSGVSLPLPVDSVCGWVATLETHGGGRGDWHPRGSRGRRLSSLLRARAENQVAWLQPI